MTDSSDLSGIIKKKAKSVINRKKRSLEKIRTLGLENYLKSKIEKYADSPALVEQFKRELHALQTPAN